MGDIVPIPGPRGLPFLGNINDFDPQRSSEDLSRLSDIYGEIFKLTLGGVTYYYICSQRLLNEVCDERRFQKSVSSGLLELRAGLGHALFTADTQDPEWGIAHRILMPAFGPMSTRVMYDEMHDIGSQLVVKWARFGEKEKIHVTDDFTRLTLDSIALCSMGTRFNSFYKEGVHPFVTALADFLAEAGNRTSRPEIANAILRSKHVKYEESIATLKRVAQEGLDERRAHPNDKKDVVNALINGRDPLTGDGMSDDLILELMITFLGAGHETTSGLLSFMFYFFLKYPSTLRDAQKEVDTVIGRGPVTVDHMGKLPYITACMRETLRLKPSAPGFGLKPSVNNCEDPILLAGKYPIPKDQNIRVVLPKIHRDPAVWGNDAEVFKPERMLDEHFSKLPPNSWKPFGNGVRACIGRSFAWQEALMITAMLLQTFNFRPADPKYQLEVQYTLTMKPKNFFMYAIPRDHIEILYLEKQMVGDGSGLSTTSQPSSIRAAKITAKADSKPKMTILYGSNSGTCEGFAQSLARQASVRGCIADVRPLDTAQGKVPIDQPVVMICSSYEGQPPDNAAHFVTWLESIKGSKELKGVRYAVFGVGNHDWFNTFHRIPKLLDSYFEDLGATRLAELGLCDVVSATFFNDFDVWQDEVFWPNIREADSNDHDEGLELEIDISARSSKLRQDVKEAVVLRNQLLTAAGEPEKRHIALKLPSGVTYKTGDYLAILPINGVKTVQRVLKCFRLPWDAMVTIQTGTPSSLPSGHPISAFDLLAAYVELTQPATRKNVEKFASTLEGKARDKVSGWASEAFEKEISLKRRSILDLLEEFQETKLTLGEYLALLPPMRIRQYSISSSPLDDPSVATITLSVLDLPSLTTDGKRFLGVTSNYLSHIGEGDHVHVAVKPSHGHFHPPADVERTPVVYICAGTGIAPFRGFIQERAKQIEAGRKLAPAYLFVGCHHPEKDAIFDDELTSWENSDIVKVFYAFSKYKDLSRGCSHVQERVWKERAMIIETFRAGGHFYVCGSSSIGEETAAIVKRIYAEANEEDGTPKTNEEIQEWFDSVKAERYASDVFS